MRYLLLSHTKFLGYSGDIVYALPAFILLQPFLCVQDRVYEASLPETNLLPICDRVVLLSELVMVCRVASLEAADAGLSGCWAVEGAGHGRVMGWGGEGEK